LIKTISADGSHQNNMFYIWVFMVLVSWQLNYESPDKLKITLLQ